MTGNLLRLPDREYAADRDDKLELRLWLRLLTCTNLIEANVRKRLRETFGTTLPRFDLMAQLDRAPEGLTMSELSSRLMVSGGNVTGLVESLQREGLVVRNTHARDRRSMVIRLTPKGRRFFRSMTPIHEQWIDALLGGMSRGEMEKLFELLGKVKLSTRSQADAEAVD
jgi:DNA-binding MarR family transcriptional regulator